MAGVLAAFDMLEAEEIKKHPKKGPKPTNTKFRNPLSPSTSNSKDTRQGRSSRPRSLPPPSNRDKNSSPTSPSHLAPTYTGGNHDSSARSPSIASGRRISFVEAPRPASTQHRLRILTNKDSLASGFVFDPKLKKYSVTEIEWHDFCAGVIDKIELSRTARLAWKLAKNDVVKKVKKDLQYGNSDLMRYFNEWNRQNFKRKGFTVSMEVPGDPRIRDEDSLEQREQVRKEAKYFRMVVTPNAEKAGSIYSRTSSLTRGVSNEGLSLQPSKDEDQGDDEKAQMDDTDAALAAVKQALEEQSEGLEQRHRGSV